MKVSGAVAMADDPEHAFGDPTFHAVDLAPPEWIAEAEEAKIERVAREIYSEDPELWDDGLRIVNGTFGGEGFMAKHPDVQARYKQEMDDAREVARRVLKALRAP